MVGTADNRLLPSTPAMVVLSACTAASSSLIWLPHWPVALPLSAARLAWTLSRAAWIPALPAWAGSSWSSSATDAFSAAASAQAWVAAAVVPLAAVVVVVAGAGPLVSSPGFPQAAGTRQTRGSSRYLAGTDEPMLASGTARRNRIASAPGRR